MSSMQDENPFPNLEFDRLDIKTAVNQAVGAGSMCWENLENTGVYQDGRAKNIADQLITRIEGEIESEVTHALATTEYIEGKSDVTEPLEWSERQEQERRAWALSTAVEAAPHVVFDDIVSMAKNFEDYVKGPPKQDPDLHDQDALDTWGVVMIEQFTEIFTNVETATGWKFDLDRDEFLDNLQHELTKAGVRFKNGNVLD